MRSEDFSKIQSLMNALKRCQDLIELMENPKNGFEPWLGYKSSMYQEEPHNFWYLNDTQKHVVLAFYREIINNEKRLTVDRLKALGVTFDDEAAK